MTQCFFLPMNTWFPNRHQTFIRTLSQHFTLVVHQPGQWAFQGENILDTTDVVERIGDVTTLLEFQTEWLSYRAFMLQAAEKMLGHALVADSSASHLENTKPIVAEALKTALVLDEMARQTSIDAVVTCTDYTPQARPVIYMAQQLGIPTVQVEHGLFSTHPYPPPGTEHLSLAPFASNFVILDNQLEVDIYQRYNLQSSVKQLLPLGTPLDNATGGVTLSTAAARRRLNISPGELCVTVGLSWSEPHGPVALAAQQAEEVMFVRFVFESVQLIPQKHTVRIFLKLHPAISNFRSLNAAQNFYAHLAMQYGLLSQTTILVDGLHDVIAAADLVVTRTYSSILWDCIMHDTPTAFVTPYAWRNVHTPPAPPSSAVADAGLLTYIQRQSEFIQLIEAVSDSDTPNDYSQKREAFCQKWEIRSESPKVKSERIVKWLKEMA
ncbi:MAG: hypothetical protein JXR76_11885 [Deltaproteobacteria bacterium]|nr:hypothetical protein [Deltaproteobacteria bacterium]